MFREHDKARTKVEQLSTDLMGLLEQVSAHSTVQAELAEGHNTSSWFEARWKSGREHAIATELHVALVFKPLTGAQAKLAPEKFKGF